VLIVDDNRDLLRFLERLMAQSGWKLLTAESAEAGRELVTRERPSVALLDYVLPDENGVALGVRLREMAPGIPVIIMSGAELPGKDQITCEEHDFQILQKPFLANEIMNQIRTRLSPDSASAGIH
jgi:DNA-binding response OmpR family regulator